MWLRPDRLHRPVSWNRPPKIFPRIQTLAQIDLDKTNGSWRTTTLAIKGDLLVVAKCPDEARAVYRKALAEPSLPASMRKVIKKSLAELF